MQKTLIQKLSKLVPAAFWASVIVWASHQTNPLGEIQLPEGADKVIHVGIYAILAGLSAWGFWGTRFSDRFVLLFLLLLCFALFDEAHQFFILGREASFWDLVADVLGVFIGLLFTNLLAQKRSRHCSG